MDIRIAHSPDSDDAFMFYALAKNKLPVGKFRFHHTLHDIETLNRKAFDGEFEVTAISFHAYPYIEDKYMLLPSGASMGDGYGPIVVARKQFGPDELVGKRIAIPGTLTSACLALKLFQPDFEEIIVPFDQIIDVVKQGGADAGILIHEGQLTYADEDLRLILDLGVWWRDKTGLPLPLGGNVIRRDLGTEDIKETSRLLRESIRYSLDHRKEALEYALEFARNLDSAKADRFVGMYVNERTLDYGEDGRNAVQLFFDMAHDAGIIPGPVKAEFAD